MKVGSYNTTPTKPGILKMKNKFANLTPSENDESQASAHYSMPSNTNYRARLQQNLKNKLQIDEKDIVQEDLTGETSSPVKFKFKLHNTQSKDSRMSGGEGDVPFTVDLKQHASDTFASQEAHNSKENLINNRDPISILDADGGTEELYIHSQKSD